MTATRTSPRASISTRVWLDISLFAGYVLLSAPQTTGIPFHEYFTVVFIPIFVAHIVLDWAWIARVFRRSGHTRPGETRFNRAFDVVLFIAMVVVIYSGFLISESILPDFGVEPVANGFWATLHEATGNLLLDAAAGSAPVAAGPEDAELEGLASVAGLLKVAVFLGVGALIARPIRRRLRGVLQ